MKTPITHLLVLTFCLLPLSFWGQNVSVNDNGAPAHPSAMLDVQSTTSGMLVPRMTALERDAVANPALGLLVFVTDSETFWFYEGTAWVEIVTDTQNELNTGMVLNNTTLELTDPGATLSADLSSLIDDADADPGNELQNWGNLPGIPAPFADGVDNVDDADADPTNEWQNWGTLPGIPAGFSDNVDDVNDADPNPANELNTGLSLSGHVLTLSDPGGTLTADFSGLIGTQDVIKDADNDTKVMVEMTPDDDQIRFEVSGYEQMILRRNNHSHSMLELKDNSSSYNLFIGREAGEITSAGSNNTFIGHYVGKANSVGSFNSAFGYNALAQNYSGTSNTAIGMEALEDNLQGESNTAVGRMALNRNTSGYQNTAVGHKALYNSSNRSGQVAIGYEALYSNGIGIYTALDATYNTAVGYQAMKANTSGYHNTANGYRALTANTTGDFNTATGFNAMLVNQIGEANTAFGNAALSYLNPTVVNQGDANTAIGFAAGYLLTKGKDNTFVGTNTRVSSTSGIYNNSTAVGHDAYVSTSNQMIFGNSSVSSIAGKVGWTAWSDGDYKNAVAEDVPGLAFINRLRPVSYQWDMNKLAEKLREDYTMDSMGREVYNAPDEATLIARRKKGQIRQTGFIAQEVEKSAQDLGFEFSGVDKPQNEDGLYGLRYAEFVVPLVKATQEQQVMIEEQQALIDQQETRLQQQEAQIQQMQSQIQMLLERTANN